MLTALTGCGLRVGDGPRQGAPADEAALLRALSRARHLHRAAQTAARADVDLAHRLAALHATQVTALERLLPSVGIPVPPPTGVPTSSSPPTRTTTAGTPSAGGPTGHGATGAGPTGKRTGPRSTKAARKRAARRARLARAELARQEAADVGATGLARLGRASSTNVAVLGSLAAQHDAAHRLLGPDTRRAALAGPTDALAARLLTPLRSAVYGFEVVTAQTPPQRRDAAAATLASLQRRRDEVRELAGRSAPPAPLGYRLPFRLHGAASRAKLARHVLHGLATSTAALFEAAAGDVDAVTGVVHVLSDAVVLGHDWDVPLRPFPGLELP